LQGLLPDGTDREAGQDALRAHARDFAERTAASAQYRDALRITQLVSEISPQGPEGRHLCQELLNSVAEFTLDQHEEPAGDQS
jgi:hypothetical protein